MIIENEIVYIITEHVKKPYCNKNIKFENEDYKFCMNECELEGCKGQYHKFIINNEEIEFLIDQDSILDVEEYKESIKPPKEKSIKERLIESNQKIDNLEALILQMKAKIDVI